MTKIFVVIEVVGVLLAVAGLIPASYGIAAGIGAFSLAVRDFRLFSAAQESVDVRE